VGLVLPFPKTLPDICSSPVEQFKGDMLLQRNYLKGKSATSSTYKTPEIVDETPCKQTGILKANR